MSIFDTTINNYYDTVYLHDTIYVTTEGIDGVDGVSAKIYQRGGQIVVEGAEGNTVTLYDAVGRVLATRCAAALRRARQRRLPGTRGHRLGTAHRRDEMRIEN